MQDLLNLVDSQTIGRNVLDITPPSSSSSQAIRSKSIMARPWRPRNC